MSHRATHGTLQRMSALASAVRRVLPHVTLTAAVAAMAAGAGARVSHAQIQEPADAIRPSAARIYRPFVIGEAAEHHHMRIVAQMHPAVPVYGLRDDSARSARIEGKEYVHVSANVRARTGNPYGFRNGEWVPGLQVLFTLTHEETGTAVEGQLFPMVARDGPRYGINVEMLGEGDYTLVLFLQPPSAKTLTRVTDELIGVPEWWKPFDMPFRFTYKRADVFPE